MGEVEPLAIEETDEFIKWITRLTDSSVLSAVTDRIDRLRLGLAGDAGPVGEGVSELRVHVGAGWRIYYVRRGDAYLMLNGGSKRTQKADIKLAKTLAEEH